jgi:plastocyanin
MTYLVLIVAIVAVLSLAIIPMTYAQQQQHQVTIGEGSTSTTQQFTFTPNNVDIRVGDSVRWTSFTGGLVDIHTVTFVQDPEFYSDIFLPFTLNSNTTDYYYSLQEPFTGEPVILQDGRTVVGINKIAFYPSVIGFDGSITYPPQSADIVSVMNSTVGALNSGVVLPPPLPTADEGERTDIQPPFPSVNSFTVTFEESGTYPYFCAIHPWMIGTVNVS